MITTIAALTLGILSASMPAQTDTTFAVRAPMRLVMDNFSGAITVRAWNRDAVRVKADHSSRSFLVVRRNGPNLVVVVEHRRGIPTTVEYELTVPTWMALQLGGVSTEISIEGTQAEIKAESVSGDVVVVGGSGFVTVGSVSGDVSVKGATGKVQVNAVSGDARIEHANGPIVASSVNGDVVLQDIDSNDVQASTVNGEVIYEGVIQDGGDYHFGSHGGDVTVAVPSRVNATVSVSTFQGDFSSDFPVSFTGTRHGSNQFSFTLGSGSARLELESFQGEIRLRRPDSNTTGYRYRYDKTHTTKSKSKDHESEDEQP